LSLCSPHGRERRTGMRYVLVTLSGGIIERVALYDSAKAAVQALSDYVRRMNP
jgi:hypothetical protein